MSNNAMDTNNTPKNTVTDSSDRVGADIYDPHIIPAETGARMDREGDQYKTHPTEQREASAATDDQTDGYSVHTTDGYSVDKEGLLNNYAIEPEMYYEVPGDARQASEADEADRAAELSDVNDDQEGNLTMDHDSRGRGPGIV